MKAKKYDKDKIPVHLVPWEFVREIAKVLAFGAKKYEAFNWALGMDWSRVLRAAQDHLGSWSIGDDIDSESKLSHLCHAACCIMFLIIYQMYGIGRDDRWKRPKEPEPPKHLVEKL